MGARERWRIRPTTMALCIALLVASVRPRVASADPASATGKGIAGGALLGSELAVFGEAIGGVRTRWIYWVGAGAGLGAGAAGGYFIEQELSTKWSFYTLLVSMALSIPATITYLDATANVDEDEEFLPPDGPNYDEEPLPEDMLSMRMNESRAISTGRGVRLPHRQPAPALNAGALLHWHGDVSLGVPLPEASLVFSRRELALFDVPQQLRWSATIARGTF
jgi:hypothetical protein